MYLDFYQLSEEAFRITPDPKFLYLSPSHREAFASVVYGVNARKGFVVVTGEVGTGKTTVLRAYLSMAQGSGVHPIYLFDPDITYDALLALLLRELGAPAGDDGLASPLERLQMQLIAEFTQGRNVVLLIDEAQNMPVETLEKLRLLSNLETEQEKLLQIVLVGQPELDHKLDLYALRQLKQRIAVRAAIQPLSPRESTEYIRFRLDKAGALGPVFSRRALSAITLRAKGIPRTLNILCDNALIAGYGSQRRPVPARIAARVARELSGAAPVPAARRTRSVAALALVVLVVGLISGLGIRSSLDAAGSPLVTTAKSSNDGNVLPRTYAADAESAPDSTHLAAVPSPIPLSVPHVGDTQAATTAPEPAAAPVSPAPPAIAPAVERVDPPPVEAPVQQATLASAPAPAPAQAPAELRRVAGQGDCLTRLITEIYGYCNGTMIEFVQRHNPGIQNVDVIHVGQEIVFPASMPDNAADSLLAAEEPGVPEWESRQP